MELRSLSIWPETQLYLSRNDRLESLCYKENQIPLLMIEMLRGTGFKTLTSPSSKGAEAVFSPAIDASAANQACGRWMAERPGRATG